MGIMSLYIENFKGIKDGEWIPIKPITIFIGANSSGKSSCIHALACLSQTAKLPNNSRPLILDDEYAYVHLGRFIEAIHSKSYKDPIRLGLELEGVPHVTSNEDNSSKSKYKNSEDSFKYSFSYKSTLRTQNVFLESANIASKSLSYNLKRKAAGFETSALPGGLKFSLSSKSGFNFERLYTDLSKERFFSPEAFSFDLILAHFRNFLQNTLYLGPFRQPPIRRYPTRGSNPTEVGAQGEATITMLANEIIQSNSRHNINQIAKWLNTLGIGKKLEISRVGTSDLFDVTLTLSDGNTFPIADLGYGISQILPVLTQCSFAPEGSTLLFEQPELHLHTLSSSKLASVFIETIKKKNTTIIAETHSPELVGAFLNELRAGNISLDNIVIYRVKREGSRSMIKKIEIEDDDFDIYENWESGISRV